MGARDNVQDVRGLGRVLSPQGRRHRHECVKCLAGGTRGYNVQLPETQILLARFGLLRLRRSVISQGRHATASVR